MRFSTIIALAFASVAIASPTIASFAGSAEEVEARGVLSCVECPCTGFTGACTCIPNGCCCR